MKKVLFIVGLIIFFTNSLFAKENIAERMEREQREQGFYVGDPNKNEILEANEDYIVIRNNTAITNITIKFVDDLTINISAEVFWQEAQKHCKKNKKNHKVNSPNYQIDTHIAYFYCTFDPLELIYKSYNITSEKDKKRFTSIPASVCFDDSETEKDIISYCKNNRDFKYIKKNYPQAKQFYKDFYDREKKFEDESFIYNIKQRALAINNQPSISNEDQNTVVAASSGTGFFVSTNGHMVTNNHVIEGCDTVKAHYKGRELNADVLFTDRSNDLAIIKANIKPEKVFPVSNEDVSLLEDIIVAGYPLGKNISASIKTFKGSVTALSGFGDNFSNFQIDASLSSGNSGGPIINQKGNVVGVAVEKLVEVGVEGFNFGVKSSTLKTFASSNQIKFQDPSTEELSNKELGQLITEATIYLECWMSVAKIKQIIQEGERQKAFFSEYK